MYLSPSTSICTWTQPWLAIRSSMSDGGGGCSGSSDSGGGRSKVRYVGDRRERDRGGRDRGRGIGEKGMESEGRNMTERWVRFDRRE